MDTLYELAAWLDYIKQTSGVHVIISGLTDKFTDPAINELILPHTWHINPFCLAVKADRVRWDLCIRAKRIHYHQMKHCAGDCAGHYCPFGVFEVSWPVRLHGRVVGSVSAATYRGDPDEVRARIERMSAKHGMDPAFLIEQYARSMIVRGPEQIAAECQLPMVGRALANLASEGAIRMTPEAGESHELIARATDYIFAHASEPMTVPEICRHLNVSESHMQHLFKRVRGQSIVKTIADARLQWARQLLIEGRLNVAQTAQACGFSDANYFSTVFTRRYGTTPSALRKQRR